MTGNSARTLAIADDPAVKDALAQTLCQRFECECVADVAAAREKLAEDDFDLVLCDIRTPGDPGFALAEELIAETSKPAVVITTDSDDQELVNRVLELGVHGYLVKPFPPGQLLVTTQTALRRRALEADERTRRRTLLEQVQAAMDAAPVPIFVKDLDRRYLLANRVAHEVLGVEPGGLIGRTDAEVLSPEAETLIREGDMRVLRNKEPCEREATVPLEGGERTFLTVRFPYLDRNGDLGGVTGVAADITAQREAERLQRDLATTRERTIEELRSSRQEAVERLARAIELHDAATGRHLDQMGRIASYLGSQLGLDDEQITLLRAAAPMHDVGKIATPREVLRKPGPLSPEERAEVERHAEVGHQILAGSESELLRMAARIALTHHEWFDGNGYPRGLSGEEIPIEGRIVAVADVFDVLLSDRPYRQAMSIDEAVEVIRNGRGTQFDPEVVDSLLEHLEDVLALRS
ncbi:MAG: PAS domain-containing protein [Actinomycetota bacterium]|nr:PAS domain-containing protein [Actinomycetota bacterium]